MSMPLALVLAVLSSAGCFYDYNALGGPPGTTSGGETGGSTMGPEVPDGSGGATGTGGAGAASGGRAGRAADGGSGGPAAGGTGGGGRGNGGIGGTGLASITGGAGGSDTGAATGGAGGGGATGVGGATVGGIISIDFVGGMPMAGAGGGAGGNGAAAVLVAAPAMTQTEIAGVKPVARWNSAPGVMGTLNDLVQSDGRTSSASATWKATPSDTAPGVWKNRFTDAPGNVRMMNGYLDPVSSALPATVAISNLPADMAAAGYDVYVYVSGDVPSGTRTYNYAIGASSASVVQTGPTPATFSGFVLAPNGGMGNTIVFRNVTGAAFTLTAQPPAGAITRAPINGMQIVSPPGS